MSAKKAVALMRQTLQLTSSNGSAVSWSGRTKGLALLGSREVDGGKTVGERALGSDSFILSP